MDVLLRKAFFWLVKGDIFNAWVLENREMGFAIMTKSYSTMMWILQ